MRAKKRKYEEPYIQFSFASVIIHSEEKSQCVLCNKVLTNDSMKPAKLKQRLENVHPQHINKDKTYFERQRRELKSMKLDAFSNFFRKNNQLLEASYLVAFEIAKQKKPRTIGKTLIKPCIPKTVGIVLGKEAEKKLAAISLSNKTIQRRIKNLSLDIKSQVVQEIKTASFGLFAIQLDESTDISSCAQLMVYARYVCNNAFKEEFLFCSAFETTTKATDILNKVTTIFTIEGLE